MFNSRKLIRATSTPEVVPEGVAFDGSGDVKVLEQELFAVFKHAPDMIH